MNIDNIISREEFNSVKDLNYDQFSDFTMRLIKLCVEESLRSLPSVMVHLSNQAAYLRELSNNFYKDNKDLGQHRALVTQIIEKVEGENPGMKYEEVLKKAAKCAREALSKVTKETSVGLKNLPHFDSKLKDL